MLVFYTDVMADSLCVFNAVTMQCVFNAVTIQCMLNAVTMQCMLNAVTMQCMFSAVTIQCMRQCHKCDVVSIAHFANLSRSAF